VHSELPKSQVAEYQNVCVHVCCVWGPGALYHDDEKFPRENAVKGEAALGQGVVGGRVGVAAGSRKEAAPPRANCKVLPTKYKSCTTHSQTDDFKEHVAETVPYSSRLCARHAEQHSRHPCHRPFHARLWQWCLLRLHPDVHERCPWSRHEGKKMSQTQRCRTLLQATSVTVSTPPRSDSPIL
jgi:hypothetical protein